MVICSGNGGQVLFVGLSHDNLDRLKDGQPIAISRASHGMAVPEDLHVVIAAASTEAELETWLRAKGFITEQTVRNQKRPL